MPDPASRSPTSPDPSGGRPEPAPALVAGRGRLRDYALKRLKASRMLQASMVTAILCYGAIPFLLVFPDPGRPRLSIWVAFMMVLMSLASWSLLFWWYPVLERTVAVLGKDARGRTIANTLESLAIGCVVVVHALMAFIIIRAGVSP